MPQYVALLGRQTELSLAELAAAVPGFVAEDVDEPSLALFESDVELDQKFLNTLGGTQLIARAISDQSFELSDVPRLLVKELEGAKKKKVTFSLRAYGLAPREIRTLYRSCKESLKKDGRPSRYVGTERKAAPVAVLHQEELIAGKQGCEFTIVRNTKGSVWLGRTVAVQDIDAYTKRDIEKPVRDTKVGLLPPKLAQMLLNYGAWLVEQANPKSASKKKLTVYDPFCGTGVIPMESLLRCWPVLASDLSAKAVKDCEKNLDWLRKEEKVLKKKVSSTVWKQDACEPFGLKELPDVVVTETTLGPPLSSRPTLKDISKMRTQIEHLQADFLRNAAEHLAGVPIACTWPVWYSSKGPLHLDAVWEVVQELGYQAVIPGDIEVEATQHATLLYRRPGQFVGREIVLLLPPQ